MKGVQAALVGLSLATSALAASVQSWPSNPTAQDVSVHYLQVANGSNTDVRLRLMAPSAPGWAAVAIGQKMSGSLFFVMHPSSDGSKATVSIRTTSGHVMPTPIEGVSYQVSNSSVSNGVMSADVTCHSCTSWAGGSLNTMSTDQKFIWAKGPGTAVNSDAQDAVIKMHSLGGGGYGHFTINTADSQFTAGEAPATSFLPTGAAVTGSSSSGSSSSSDSSDSSDSPEEEAALQAKFYKFVHVHAILFCLAWLLFAPTALWALRLGSVRLHYIMQMLTLCLVIPAFGVAVYMSSLMPSFSNYDTWHQIIGISVFSAAIAQALGGAVQHTFFKQHVRSNASATSGSDTEATYAKDGVRRERVASVDSDGSNTPKPFYLCVLSHVHMWFGRAVMVLGALNAPLGFYFISEYAPEYHKYTYAVGIPALFTVGFTILAVGLLGFRQRRR